MVNKMVTKMVPHYGLRKLSVGVASVLLGTTIYGYNVAHADTLSLGNTNENENTDAGGQMPYQEGKNANAVNDNEQQANNQENIVNDQQTSYADSLAVLDLNNNYQNVGSQYVEREVSENKVAVTGNSNDPRITGKWMTTQKDTSGNAQAVEHEIKSSFQWDTWAVANSVPTIKWTTTVSPVFSKNNVPDVLELRNKYHLNHDEFFADHQSRPDYLLKDELTGNTNSEAVAVSNNMYIVATETFNNLGNSYVLKDDGSKVKIGHVDRIYFSPDGDGVVSIKKSGTDSWGPELSPNELPVVRSPFGQLATIYGDIKSIGVRNVFYDVNGNKINIPIFNDVMYIRGLHNHWGMRGTGGSTVYPGYNSGFDDDQRYVLAKGDGDDSDSAIAIGSSNSGFRYGSLNGTWSPGWGSNSGMVILDRGATYLEEVPSGEVSVEFSSYVPSNLGYKVMRTNSYRRTINLLDQNGNVIADPIIQQASWNDFSKDGNKWVSDNTFKYVDAVIPPHIDGYITNAKVIPPVQGISRDHAGNDIVNVYYVSKMASLPELDTNDAYALNPKNNMHEHKNVNDNGGFDKDYWGTIDPTCWNYSVRGDVISLDGLKSGDSQHVIIPNIADFQVKGIDHGAKRVMISSSVMRKIAEKAHTIALSKTNNQKIGASDQNWSDAFGGTTQAKTSDGDPGISAFNASLERMDLHNFDTSNIVNMYQMFNWGGFSSLGDLSEWDTSHVTNMNSMFNCAKSIEDLGNLDHWNTQRVEDMSWMFSGTFKLSNVGNLGNWETGNVTNMYAMFDNAESIDDLGNLGNWNVSNVINMGYMFQDAKALSSIGDLSHWKVGNVKDFSYMFSNAESLKDLGNIGEWDTSQVTDMGHMFHNARSLTNIGKLNKWDTGNVTSMMLMFAGASSLSDIGNLDNWNTSRVTNMTDMFGSDSRLTNIGDLSNWDVSQVTDLSYMFVDDSALQNVGNLSRWNVGEVTNATQMFKNAVSLKKLDISNWNFSKMNSMGDMFARDFNLVLIANNIELPSDYSNRLPRFDAFSDHMAVVTDNDQLLKSTGNTDDYTIDGQKFTRPIFYQSNGSADAVSVIKAANQKLMDGYTAKHPDKLLKYDSSQNMTDPIALANASFVTRPNNVDTMITFVISDSHLVGSDLTLNGPSQTKINPNDVKIPDGYILDGSLPDMYYGNNYTIKLKRKQIPIPSNDPSVKCGIQLHVSFNVPQKYQNDPQYRSHSIDYNYSRTGYTDGVTGQNVFTPWRINPAIPAVTIPSLSGYSTSWNIAGPSSDKGTGEVISADFLDKLFKQFLNANAAEPSAVYLLDVTYTPNQQSQLINYVDTATGKTIHQQMVNGVTDQTVNVASEVPANWKLANGQTFPTSITLTNNSSPLTVKITHQINSLNPPVHGPYPSHTQKSDWYRTVRHIINFKVPSKYADNPLYKQVVQTINFSRKGEVDAVTGKVNYFDWQQDNKFMNVTVPGLDGYMPSQTTVIAPVVNADSKDIITNVTYTPNQQSQLINYVDATSGKTIHQQSVNGVTDQIVNVASEVPVNWKLADGQTLPLSITLSNNSSPLVVKITHVINPANPSPYGPFPAGTQKSDWYRTVKHIVNFEVPSKYASNPAYKQVVQTINFSRKGEVDAVTGKVSYFDWQQDSKFMNVTVPGLDGYTPSQTTVIAPVVNADSKDIITDVTYMANPSSVRISYVDNDNREISHQDFSGVTDQDVKINAQLPANWKLASGQQVPEVITLLARPRTIQVVVEHIVNNVQPGENGPWPGNTNKSDWYRTVIRTISFKVPDKYSNQSQFKTVVQTVNFKRSGHLDTVTNKVTFDAWQRTGQFDVVKVPGLTGYTTNYVTVDQVVPGADDQNSVVDVTYTPKAESQLINYVDANGQVIHRQKVDGKMDDTIKVTPDIPAHWKLSQGVSVPGTITLTDQPGALSYQIEHIIDNLTPSENGPYPHGTKKSDWFRTVTRTINFTVPDKYGKEPQFKTITQTVNFKRTGHYDQALDKVSFDPWQRIGQFDAVKVPQLFGYTTSTDQVVGEVPTENSSNQTVNVAYAPQTATLWINFVTPDGQQVGHVDDNGVFDTVIDLGINWHNDLPSGYQIYDRNIDQDLGSLPIDFLTKTINVVVVPTQTMKMQTKTVTRRIHLQMPNGTEQVVTQSAVFTRQLTMQMGSKDPVEVGAWSPDAWLVAYQPSHLDGYTVDNVKSVLVSGDSNDQDVYLKYQAIAQPTTVTFALTNGQIVDSVKVDDLKTAQVSNLVPKGYHLLNSEAGASRLLVEPDMVTYNGNMSNVPGNVGELKRTVKRTIIMVLANGRTRRIVQQVRFTRTATVNQATGEITYGDWHAVGSSRFNRINVPKRAGKTIRILGGNVNAVAVNANMHDSVVRVRYI